jgi:hypothetical protein
MRPGRVKNAAAVVAAAATAGEAVAGVAGIDLAIQS